MQGEPPAPFRSNLEAGARFLASGQDEEGCWKGRYNGPLFLIPAYLSAYAATGRELSEAERAGFLRYLLRHQGEDGGWGLHLEDASRAFPTVTCYVAARFCGLARNSPEAAAARSWMERHGDARSMAPWGKYLLALLGLYDYRGLLPVTPELWLLPRWVPLHPGRLWNHARMVYLPLSYLYGRRWRGPGADRLADLTEEIFGERPGPESWEGWIFSSAERDRYVPLGLAYRFVARLLLLYERRPVRRWRERALDYLYDQIRQEDENTHYLCVGPISKIFNLLARHDREPGGAAEEAHWRALAPYLCEDEEGLSVNGYNHSRLWDAAFALQALASTATLLDSPEPVAEARRRGLGYVRAHQLTEDTPEPERYFRDGSRGGWPFSDRLHGWPITDCTAEGLKVCLDAGDCGAAALPPELAEAAVERILAWQNSDGGWPTYERRRAPVWLETLNPSMVFAEIMVDHSHVECTSACLQALTKARTALPGRFDSEIERAVARGAEFLRRRQRSDGSWLGGWGVCFTYGAWFGTWGLAAAGGRNVPERLAAAADFLVARQLPDGGWAETVENCREGRYLPHAGPGHPVKTAWAALALTRCGPGHEEPMRRALEFLAAAQEADGGWPDEPLNGVFNRTCAIRYDNYRRIFPLWALAEGSRYLGPNADSRKSLDDWFF